MKRRHFVSLTLAASAPTMGAAEPPASKHPPATGPGRLEQSPHLVLDPHPMAAAV